MKMIQDAVPGPHEQAWTSLTLAEAASLLGGASTWTTAEVARLGIAPIRMTDGPNGARGEQFFGGAPATCFPAAVALGASWDGELVREVGMALAREALDKGASVLLAPTVNLQRLPLNGRHFECFSEDPALTAELACAFVEGVQSQEVAATLKHFAGNESEVERDQTDSRIDERTLREVYLWPFERAIRQAGAWAVMAAYNRLNGTHCSEHAWLLRQVLRRDWGFDGVAMSDWYATHGCEAPLLAGLDLEMPGPARHRTGALADAARTDPALEDAVRRSARRVLRLADRVRPSPRVAPTAVRESPAHRALARRAGAEGMVLLRNPVGLLPLQARPGLRVAVIGPNADRACAMGGGSSHLRAHRLVTPLAALRERAGREGFTVEHAPGCTCHRRLPVIPVEMKVDFFDAPEPGGEPVLSRSYAATEAVWFGHIADGLDADAFSVRAEFEFVPDWTGDYRASLVSAGRSRWWMDEACIADAWIHWAPGSSYFACGNDEAEFRLHLEAGRRYRMRLEYSSVVGRPLNIKALRAGLHRPDDEHLMDEAVACAARADVVVFVGGLNDEWDTEGEDRPTLALPGRQDELIRRVAQANPRTVAVLHAGGPVLLPWADEVPAILLGWYAGQEVGHAVADVLFGDVEPGGRLPHGLPHREQEVATLAQRVPVEGRMVYRERLLLGYRQPDAGAWRYAFGHGLGYTDFSLGEPTLEQSPWSATTPGEEVIAVVECTVSNRGARAGKAVVQLYAGPAVTGPDEPRMQLRQFAARRLAPGATGRIRLPLRLWDLAHWDVDAQAWTVEAGRRELMLGFASDRIEHRLALPLPARWVESRRPDVAADMP